MPSTRKQPPRTVVVALGGNAILQPGQLGTFAEQLFNIDAAMRRIAALAAAGWRVVLTHGNGPQVGNLLIQNALAAKTVAPMPMDVCGAESQGQIGYLAAQALGNHLAKRKLAVPVVTVVTQVAVDPADPAFERPTKPVGPFYSEAEARRLMLEEGLAMREDAGRGWRRVVPSPEPVEIVELAAIRDLVERGCLVVCAGGGGVPVVRRRGALAGTAAVIDKDLAAALLARELSAQRLLILTDVPRAYLHYGTAEQAALERVGAAELRALAAEGHFKAGSMGPKVEACLRFAASGGEAVIASLTEVEEALAGTAGTHVVPDAAAPARRRAAQPPAAKKAAAKKPGRTKKPAARKPPAGTPRKRPPREPGAEVIDIASRRRAAGE